MPDNAADFYANPENQTPKGPGRRRTTKPALSSHVPVRFAASTLAVAKVLADADGVTVSTWIRNLVTREINRRMPPKTTTEEWGFKITGLPRPDTTTSPTTGPDSVRVLSGMI